MEGPMVMTILEADVEPEGEAALLRAAGAEPRLTIHEVVARAPRPA